MLNGLKKFLFFNEARQQVIAKNIAHSNTPGFVAKDLHKFDFASTLKHVNMKITAPNHIMPPEANIFGVVSQDGDFKPDGNNVSLEKEMLKMSETMTNFQSTTMVIKKALAMLKRAAGVNN